MLGIPEIVIDEIPVSEDNLEIYTGTYKWGSTMAPVPFPVSVAEGTLRVSGRPLRAIGNHTFCFFYRSVLHSDFHS